MPSLAYGASNWIDIGAYKRFCITTFEIVILGDIEGLKDDYYSGGILQPLVMCSSFFRNSQR